MKKLAVLGSTGSIGTQTLDIVRERPEEFQVTALAAGSNVALLEEQVAEFRPKLVSLTEEKDARELQERLRLRNIDSIEVVYGIAGLTACACEESADMTVNAVVGMVGILPTVAAIRAGKDIALANKETLVTAGHIIMPLVKEYNVKLLPVDSEHSAVFQCLSGSRGADRREAFADGIGRSLFRENKGGAWFCYCRTGAAAPELEHGEKDYN